jgi:Sulfatase-modifying factor enzyme 1/PEGA domain
MTRAALTSAINYAQVRVREPLGERTFGETPTIGGDGADVVVPGLAAGIVLQIERLKGVWMVRPVAQEPVRFDGQLLIGARDLRRQDVISIGDAQIVVTDTSRTLLRIDVCHLVGNQTIAPATTISGLPIPQSGDEDLEIHPRALIARGSDIVRSAAFRHWQRALGIAAAVVLVSALIVASMFQGVTLDVEPGDAGIHVLDTPISLHTQQRLWLLPGTHLIRAEHAGYRSAEAPIVVAKRSAAVVRLRLEKLPGTLQIDTASVAAVVSIDGVESGRAPGAITVQPGQHTLTVRAPRYVEYIATVDIAGALARQSVRVNLQPAWGTLQISVIPSGARVTVDGVESGVAPVVIEAPSGVRHVQISAPDLKVWESSVVLNAGEVLSIGPITLGEPDAHLALSSEPGGAEVMVSGVLRGHTPLALDLPPGIRHELVVTAQGYAPWTQSVMAEAGKTINVRARLESVGARVTIQGEPDGAQLLVDGIDRGRTPRSLQLSAVEHRIEVRKEGWIAFTTSVTPAPGLDRTLDYRLLSKDGSLAPGAIAATLYTQTGYLIRLMPSGTFHMTRDDAALSGRNDGGRQVTLRRAFYIGVEEITNEQFRRFRPDHSSGLGAARALDLDDQPVRQVSWSDAAQFCNWLSVQDSVPPAYERRGDHWILRRPVTMGYRLPTDAEWDYAAHYSHALTGNLSEWINDYYSVTADATPVTDPLGPDEGTRHLVRAFSSATSSTTGAAEPQPVLRANGDGGTATLSFRVVRYAE